MNIEELLTKRFCDVYHIDIEQDYKIEFVDAIELLVPERIDLIAKYKYVECNDKGYDIPFISDLYERHIEAFSSGKYAEPGNPDKVCLQDYINTFHSLIDNIKTNGLDPGISVIPVGRDHIILNGAHRVAIALYYGLKVPIVRFEHLYDEYKTDFFRKRMLDEKYLDYMVAEYIKLKKNVYIACLYPAAIGKDNLNNAIKAIKLTSNIIYQKEFTITKEGLRSLIIQIYKTDSNKWIGSYENHYVGANKKVQECTGKASMRIFAIECNSLDFVKDLKNKIRDIYNIKNGSIHITDTQEEAISMGNIVFNRNSIHCLNLGRPDYFIKFNKKINEYKKRVLEHNLSLDEFIIDSSGVMGLYALREIHDIDFLSISKNYMIIEDKLISSHHAYLTFYKTGLENIILNPDCYLVYQDMKFITLELCKNFKINRNEKKDKMDVQLINTLTSKEKNRVFVKYGTRMKRNIYYRYLLILNLLIQKSKRMIILTLKKFGFRRNKGQ